MTVELLRRAAAHGARAAVDDGPADRQPTYADLLAGADRLARRILSAAGADHGVGLGGARVAYLTPSGVQSVVTLWAVWRAGGVAVPLALSHPTPELAYTVTDCGAAVVVAGDGLADRVRGVADAAGARLVRLEDRAEDQEPAAGDGRAGDPPDVAGSDPALIIYTSGSTGRPKGAVWTHAAFTHQVTTLVAAWRWQPDDRALLLLPLHHVHGLVNVVSCALWTGATVVVRDFDARTVWESFAADDITVLMAVPTIWYKLVDAYDRADPGWQTRVARAAGRARLMVSGSAALPVSVMERWHEITGHMLLERYGMTEIGMALSNPYDGARVPGTVGFPLPGVQTRVVDDHLNDVAGEPASGQLLVRGPGLFSGYWERPAATRDAFHDGWFLTGDAVTRDHGRFRIDGRMSVDIIKTGGYKVSALEVEEVLRGHPAVTDCAVVGLDDPEWGQTVAAAVVPVGRRTAAAPAADAAADALADAVADAAHGALADHADEAPDAAGLAEWLRTQVAPYKAPRRIVFVDALPRNAMGKVVKPRVASEIFGA